MSLQPDVFALGFYDDSYGMRSVPGAIRWSATISPGGRISPFRKPC
ncbi:MAG: hypothetical protein WDN06_13980 [Asticcacaulis sp.]